MTKSIQKILCALTFSIMGTSGAFANSCDPCAQTHPSCPGPVVCAEHMTVETCDACGNKRIEQIYRVKQEEKHNPCSPCDPCASA